MSDHLDSDGWFDKPENVSKMLKVFIGDRRFYRSSPYLPQLGKCSWVLCHIRLCGLFSSGIHRKMDANVFDARGGLLR